MDSPLKGLERLTEELRVERQKANQALQEKAQCQIEIESLRQVIENQKREVFELQNTLGESRTQINSLIVENQEYVNRQNLLLENLQEKEIVEHDFQLTKDNLEQQIDSLNQQLSQNTEKIQEQQILIDTLTNKNNSKDQMLNSLKADLLEMRKQQINLENERIRAFEELQYYINMNEELNAKIQLAGAIEDGYVQSQQSNEELKNELEKSIGLNQDLNNEIAKLQEELRTIKGQDREYQSNFGRINADYKELQEKYDELNKIYQDCNNRLAVEIEAKDAAQERCDAALRNREFLDEQLHQLKEKNQEYEQEHITLHQERIQMQTKLDNYQSEIKGLTAQVEELSHQQEKFKHMQVVNTEIEQLRNQLNAVRKQLIKRDLEDEAGVLAPKVIIERELQGRQVYENIIADLRKELERMTHRCEELQVKYNESISEASRVVVLQEEINMYKDLVKSMSAENQTVALSASEVAERNLKASHERQQLLHELHQLENTLSMKNSEIQRLTKENTQLSEKLNDLHKQKILTDQRATELFATNTKLETALEDFRQQYDLMTLDLKRVTKQLHDETFNNRELQSRTKDYTQLKQELQDLQLQSARERSTILAKEKEYEYEFEKLHNQTELLSQENKLLHEKQQSHEEVVQELNTRVQELVHEVTTVTNERDRLQQQIEDEERKKIDEQIATLKQELSETVFEYQSIEEEKQLKESLLTSLQVEVTKEREKNVLLQIQMKVLEEKIVVLNQELSMYRSIDVYHTSMHSQLLSYKQNNTSNSNNNSSSNLMNINGIPSQSHLQESDNRSVGTHESQEMIIRSVYPGVYEQYPKSVSSKANHTSLHQTTNNIPQQRQESTQELSQLLKSKGRITIDDIQNNNNSNNNNNKNDSNINLSSKRSTSPRSHRQKPTETTTMNTSPELTISELQPAHHTQVNPTTNDPFDIMKHTNIQSDYQSDSEEESHERGLHLRQSGSFRKLTDSSSIRSELISNPHHHQHQHQHQHQHYLSNTGENNSLNSLSRSALTEAAEYQQRLQRKTERERQLREKVLQEERRKRQLKEMTNNPNTTNNNTNNSGLKRSHSNLSVASQNPNNRPASPATNYRPTSSSSSSSAAATSTSQRPNALSNLSTSRLLSSSINAYQLAKKLSPTNKSSMNYNNQQQQMNNSSKNHPTSSHHHQHYPMTSSTSSNNYLSSGNRFYSNTTATNGLSNTYSNTTGTSRNSSPLRSSLSSITARRSKAELEQARKLLMM